MITKRIFNNRVQKWSKEGMLLEVTSAIRAAELVNSGKFEIINKGAIDEVYF